MGIKHLNRYLTKKCSDRSIRSVQLASLSGHTLVFDTFIYLYKYLGEEQLMEKFTQLLHLLRQHNIRPIFVFDGKPPDDKKEVLAQRREKKWQAKLLYQALANTDTAHAVELGELKKQFVRVTPSHVESVKELFRQNQVEFIEAVAEADQVCVEYVRSRKAWACVSDDMDMFVHGCFRILRSVCLEQASAVLYVLPDILQELHMTMKQFREVMVLSGTDYNQNEQVSLFDSVRWFREYKRSSNRSIEFYDWLRDRTDAIKDYDHLKRINQLFVTTRTVPYRSPKVELMEGSWRGNPRYNLPPP